MVSYAPKILHGICLWPSHDNPCRIVRHRKRKSLIPLSWFLFVSRSFHGDRMNEWMNEWLLSTLVDRPKWMGGRWYLNGMFRLRVLKLKLAWEVINSKGTSQSALTACPFQSDHNLRQCHHQWAVLIGVYWKRFACDGHSRCIRRSNW